MILSKISTFASTAIPIERMIPAIPASVSVTGLESRKVRKNKANVATKKLSDFSINCSLEFKIQYQIAKYNASAINKLMILGSETFMINKSRTE